MEKADFIDEASCILEADSKAKIGQLYDKINQFLNLISELREKANWLSLSELLDEIFQIADYPSQVANLPFAKQRLADIEKFQEWANQFEQDQGAVYITSPIIYKKLRKENYKSKTLTKLLLSITVFR